MTMTYRSALYASLKEKRVLITGGATGIGAEMVRAFCSQEAKVTFFDIDQSAGEALAGETGALLQLCDLTNIDQLRDVIGQCQTDHGAFDVVINNAARDDRHKLFDVEPDYWDHCMAVNLRHQFFVSQAVAEPMKARGSGVLILMGSISWMRARPGMIGYTTAKAAINGLAKTLAYELGPFGIRVNSLVPGAIETERQKKWVSAEQSDELIRLQALKFRLNGEHIAKTALFMASEEAAGMAAANIVVDGGLSHM